MGGYETGGTVETYCWFEIKQAVEWNGSQDHVLGSLTTLRTSTGR